MNLENNPLKNEKHLTFWEDLQSCSQFIHHSPLLKLGFIFECSFILIVILLFIFLPLLFPSWTTIMAHDFRVFYDAVYTYRHSPGLLYSASPQHFPFRYLPAFIYLFYFYTWIPFELSFILHSLFMGFLHVASFYLIYILISRFYNTSLSTKRQETLLFIALVAPLQIPNLVLGQISEIYIFLTLLGIILLENSNIRRYIVHGNHFWAGLCFGISFLYKPLAIIICPFFFFIEGKGNLKTIKIHIKSILYIWIGFCLPFLLNVIPWIQNPTLLNDFIYINASTQIWTYPSTSLTRLLLLGLMKADIHITEAWVYIPFVLILYAGVLVYYFKTPMRERIFSFFFGMAYLILMLAYPDAWFLYFLIWYMVSLPGWLAQENLLQVRYKYTSLVRSITHSFTGFYFLIQYGIIYFIFGILLAMLVIGFDPLLPLCIAILFGLSLWRLTLFTHKETFKI